MQFVEALLAGRVDIVVHRGWLWRTTSSYLDGSPRPFLVTRMPVAEPLAPHRAPAGPAPASGPRPRRLRRQTAAFTSGLIFTPGPIVDEVVMPFRYFPFADGGLARWISSSTAP